MHAFIHLVHDRSRRVFRGGEGKIEMGRKSMLPPVQCEGSQVTGSRPRKRLDRMEPGTLLEVKVGLGAGWSIREGLVRMELPAFG